MALRLLRAHLPDTASVLAGLLLRQAAACRWRVPREELLTEAASLITGEEWWLQAEIHLLRGQITQAEALLADKDDDLRALVLGGRCCMARGEYKAAVEEYFDRIIRFHAPDHEFASDMAEEHEREFERNKAGDAESDKENLHIHGGETVDPETRCIGLYWLSKAYLGLNDTVLAGEAAWLLQSVEGETGIGEGKPTPTELAQLRAEIQRRRQANPIKPRKLTEDASRWLEYAQALYQAAAWSDCLEALNGLEVRSKTQRSLLYRLNGMCRWRLGSASVEEIVEWLRRAWEESNDPEDALQLLEILQDCLPNHENLKSRLAKSISNLYPLAACSALGEREACLRQFAEEQRAAWLQEKQDAEWQKIKQLDYWQGRKMTKTMKGMLGGDFSMRIKGRKRSIPRREIELVREEEEQEEAEVGMDFLDELPVNSVVSFPIKVDLGDGIVVTREANTTETVSTLLSAAYKAACKQPPLEYEVRGHDATLLLPLDQLSPLHSNLRVIPRNALLPRYQANCRQYGCTPHPQVIERLGLARDGHLDLSIMDLRDDDYSLLDLAGVLHLDVSCIRGLDSKRLERLLSTAAQLQAISLDFNPQLNLNELDARIRYFCK